MIIRFYIVESSKIVELSRKSSRSGQSSTDYESGFVLILADRPGWQTQCLFNHMGNTAIDALEAYEK